MSFLKEGPQGTLAPPTETPDSSPALPRNLHNREVRRRGGTMARPRERRTQLSNEPDRENRENALETISNFAAINVSTNSSAAYGEDGG